MNQIKLRFHPDRIKYVLTKPIHGASQYVDKTDPENRTVIINLIPNRELYQTDLSPKNRNRSILIFRSNYLP
jgi:hypothetical protein